MSTGDDARGDRQVAIKAGRSTGFLSCDYRIGCFGAIVAGLLFRLWFIWAYAHVTGDAILYADIARNLLEHGVYGFSNTLHGLPIPPRPTLIRMPGYPLFLAACFRLFGSERLMPVLLIQAVIDLWTCVLVAATTARIFGRRAGLTALWMAALCPFTANYVAAVLTETLTLFSIALAFFSFICWGDERRLQKAFGWNRWLGLLAVALALSILLRPEQGLLAAAILLAMLWMSLRHSALRNSWRSVSPIMLVMLLTVSPLIFWSARNWHTFHVFQPLAPRYANDPGEMVPLGFQRWYRTWAIDFASTDRVYWAYDGSPISIQDLPDRAFASSPQRASTEALLTEYNETENPTPALDQRFEVLAKERIRAAPLHYYLALPLARYANMLLRPRTEMLPVPLQWWRYREHPSSSFFAFAYAALNLIFLVLAGITLRRRQTWIAHEPVVWSMMGMIALRSALLLTIDNSEPRYALEFFPIVIVFAAATLSRASGTREPAE